ncbi:MAG: hypothetical protein RSB77_00735 [Bacilli bacterium]
MKNKMIGLLFFLVLAGSFLTVFNRSVEIKKIEPKEIIKSTLFINIENDIEIIENEEANLLDGITSSKDSIITISISSTKNLKVGTHFIIYTAKNKKGETKTAKRKITVKEKIIELALANENYPPNIILKNNVFEAGINTKIPYFYADAYDSFDGYVTVYVHNNININKAGLYDVVFEAFDKEGLSSKVVEKFRVVDNIAPTITTFTNTSNGTWTNQEVNIEIDATDYETGLNKIEYSFDNINWTKIKSKKLTFKEEQNTKVYVRAIDNALNISSVLETNVQIDKTAPESLDKSDIYIEMTKEQEIVTLDTKATDNLSGIEKTVPKCTIDSTTEGLTICEIDIYDYAGNITTITKNIYVKDTKAPTITSTNIIIYKEKFTNLLDTLIIDENSKDPVTVNILNSNFINEVGKYQVTFEIIDAKGNTSTTVVNYEVKEELTIPPVEETLSTLQP